MPFRDFEIRKQEFLEHYARQLPTLKAAAASFNALIEAILQNLDGVNIAKIECRVKNAEESVRKFKRKYRNAVEDRPEGYAIADYITDLIGVRVVCLYEDEPPAIMAKVREFFDVIEITDKTAPMEDSESDFGYKGIHMDLRLNDEQARLSEHRAYANQA
ncbi:MAG: RelA/SpoT domain-containing protein, partial [Comamonas sp.]